MPRCKREQTQMTITIDRTHFTPLASLAGGLYLLGAAGFCPGPALVAPASGSGAAGLFVVAMLAGMLLHDNARVRRRRKVAPA